MRGGRWGVGWAGGKTPHALGTQCWVLCRFADLRHWSVSDGILQPIISPSIASPTAESG